MQVVIMLRVSFPTIPKNGCLTGLYIILWIFVMASIYEYKKLSRPFFATEKDIIYFSNHYRSSRPKMFLKISQNSQENTCTSHNYGNRSFCKSCKNIKFVHLLAISNIVRTQVPQYWPMSLTGFHSERFSCSFFLKWLAVD